MGGDSPVTTAPAVSWYWRGQPAMNGASLVVNVLSALVLGCVVKSTGNIESSSGLAPAFVLTKDSRMTSYTPTGSSSGVRGYGLSVSGGTILYDSVNGHRANYDHLIVTTSFTIPIGTTFPVNAYLYMSIPAVSKSDTGTYYCNYISGGTAARAISFSSSGSFTLTVTTKSDSSAKSLCSKTPALQYSLVLIAASKVLF